MGGGSGGRGGRMGSLGGGDWRGCVRVASAKLHTNIKTPNTPTQDTKHTTQIFSEQRAEHTSAIQTEIHRKAAACTQPPTTFSEQHQYAPNHHRKAPTKHQHAPNHNRKAPTFDSKVCVMKRVEKVLNLTTKQKQDERNASDNTFTSKSQSARQCSTLLLKNNVARHRSTFPSFFFD